MPDYNKGKIYTIRCRIDETLIYVGSTIQPLSVRIGGHKINSRDIKRQNMLIYKTINNNWDDWYIELYEDYPCENKEQLCKREGEVIRDIGTLNTRIEGRTLKEYTEDNKDKIAIKQKTYRENNKDKSREYFKERYEQNKDEILEYCKERYGQNKDDIAIKNKEKITCECGCISTKINLLRHKKSQRHLNAINTS